MRRLMRNCFYLFICMLMISIGIVVKAIPTIDENETGSITIYRYEVEDISDFDLIASGDKLDDNIQLSHDKKLSDLKPLEGIDYKITLYEEENKLSTSIIFTGSTNEDGIVEFSNLIQGKYLVQELYNPMIASEVKDFDVVIPMTNQETGEDWIYDVHVYPKSEVVGAPKITQYVGEYGIKDASIGYHEPIQWLVEVDIPIDISKQTTTYKMSNKLDDLLVYVPDSLAVIYTDSEGIKRTLEMEDISYSEPTDNQLLTIDFDQDSGRNKLTTAFVETSSENVSEPSIIITFETILMLPLDDDYVNLLEENIGSNINVISGLNYVNSFGTVHSVNAIPANTYFGGIEIFKHDIDMQPLKDAEFKIYRSKESADKAQNALLDPNDSQKEWIITTNQNGKAYFYGLSYGELGDSVDEGATKYYIVETKAPEDSEGGYYNLLESPLEVTVNGKKILKEVLNKKGITLPFTGGMGTIIFSVVGVGLIILAVLLFTKDKKRRKNHK